MFSYLPAPREHLLIYTETPYSLELAPRSTPQVGCLESQVARVESQASFHHLAWCACSWGGRGRAQWGRQVGRWGGDGERRGGGEGEGQDRPCPPLGSSASLVPSFQPPFSASFPSVSNNGVNPLVRIPALSVHAFLFTATYCLLFKNSNH